MLLFKTNVFETSFPEHCLVCYNLCLLVKGKPGSNWWFQISCSKSNLALQIWFWKSYFTLVFSGLSDWSFKTWHKYALRAVKRWNICFQKYLRKRQNMLRGHNYSQPEIFASGKNRLSESHSVTNIDKLCATLCFSDTILLRE